MMQRITGFDKYDDDALSYLRHLFSREISESRPIKYRDVVIWLDALGRIHRENNLPAIERFDGSSEYWTHGVKVK
jgi:hypothetical protein